MSTGIKTLLYSPEVKIVIHTWDGKTYDVSRDIVRGSVTRRIDAVSTLDFTLTNKRNRYTGKISRMDRVVCFLKKQKWMQVFSGYMTGVPALDLFPTTANFKAQCTLKRLLHTYWDPGLEASANLLTAEGLTEEDGGSAGIVIDILDKVVKWDRKQINIGKVPSAFIKLAEKHVNTSDPEIKLQQLYEAMGFGGTLEGEQMNDVGASAQYEIDGLDAFLYGLRMQESGGNYKINSPATSASGAYQYITSTWNNYGGYSRAYLAPKHVQDARAAKDAQAAYKRLGGDWEKVAANHFYPAWANDKSKWHMSPGHPSNPSVRSYVNGVMSKARNYKGDPTSRTGAVTDTKLSDGRQSSVAKTVGPTVGGKKVGEQGEISGNETLLKPLNSGSVTSPYGPRRAFIKGMIPFHKGVDYGVPTGTPIRAPLSGRVQKSEFDSGSGNIIQLGHNNGLRTRYHHLSKSLVKVGDLVRQGQIIGHVGSTGTFTTGPHLHWELYISGSHTNPVPKIGTSFAVNTSGIVTDGEQMTDMVGGEGGMGDSGEITADYVDRQIFNAIYRNPPYNALSELLNGERALMNDRPVMESVTQIMKGSMRSFMSAPNGDFVAFFPDQFGFFGTDVKLELQDVELKSLKIDASDEPITTHVFAVGDVHELGGINETDWLDASYVNITQDYVFDQVLNIQPSKNKFFSPEDFLARFGARPMMAQFPAIRERSFEYFQALFLFMQQWSKQYSTHVEFTFMPELLPSFRVRVKSKNISVYVEEVTHRFDYVTGFHTDARISSPSSDGSSGLEGLPIGRV